MLIVLSLSQHEELLEIRLSILPFWSSSSSDEESTLSPLSLATRFTKGLLPGASRLDFLPKLIFGVSSSSAFCSGIATSSICVIPSPRAVQADFVLDSVGVAFFGCGNSNPLLFPAVFPKQGDPVKTFLLLLVFLNWAKFLTEAAPFLRWQTWVPTQRWIKFHEG